MLFRFYFGQFLKSIKRKENGKYNYCLPNINKFNGVYFTKKWFLLQFSFFNSTFFLILQKEKNAKKKNFF